MANVKTTRMELLALKKKVKLAQKGHNLLKEKRDALISEFFKLVDTLRSLRENMEQDLADAYKALIRAQAIAGFENVNINADTIHTSPSILAGQKTIMGVKVPTFKFDAEFKPAQYSQLTTTVELDYAKEKFEKVLTQVIKLSEIEIAAVKLAHEIKKTKRKVNALEKIVIPRIQHDIKYIAQSLQEMERENFSRLKSVKRRIEAKASN